MGHLSQSEDCLSPFSLHPLAIITMVDAAAPPEVVAVAAFEMGASE